MRATFGDSHDGLVHRARGNDNDEDEGTRQPDVFGAELLPAQGGPRHADKQTACCLSMP
ncbi:hypothetical protein [Amycolatopsis anabasis]|uniref:hypothetical protein n=1 Tax=Amycolatopsis anabasis TaxID=1840409 RepID=UPI001C5558E5|nr:hypothetical protein [Amycolatopsis anabasis]